MGPRSKVAYKYGLLRGKGSLLAKTRKNELLAIKVWGKCKILQKNVKHLAGFEPAMQWFAI